MKVQCDVCEKAAATLLCCADEAALCADCDKHVHAANKLANKHDRVPFIAQLPSSCDICQEKLGHFFCVEDRALLCRDCDVSIHTANKLVGKHKRFLVMGVQVGLDAMVPHEPMPPPPPPLVCKSPKANYSVANVASVETTQQSRISKSQEVMWQSPPPSLVCKANSMQSIHASMQTLKPLIPPIHQLASPPSTVYHSDCLEHLDELLHTNTATIFTETPSRISIPSLGNWDSPSNAFAWNAANASAYLFEDSLAEVPSTPSPSIEYQASFKRKRSIDHDELIYSNFGHTLLVPNSNIFPSFKDSKLSFSGGGNVGG